MERPSCGQRSLTASAWNSWHQMAGQQHYCAYTRLAPCPCIPLLSCFCCAPYIDDPLHFIQLFATQLHKQVIVLGWVCDPSAGWHVTCATGQHLRVFLALLHVAACGVRIEGCTAARVGAGIGHISGLAGTENSILLWWLPSKPAELFSIEMPGTQGASLRELLGQKWNDMHWL